MEREPQQRMWHNVRRNETTRVPNKHIFLDTEARINKLGKTQEQTWRLGVACYSTSRKDRPTRERWADYRSVLSLWEEVTNFTGNEGRTVLWAHNLGYDARISGTFEVLPKLGWKLTGHNITSRSSWLEWKRGKATLLMVDSTSIFPTTLAKVGRFFGLGKVSMSMESDSEEEWFARCRRDVEILKTAVQAYLQWIRDEDLGNWQMTGAGQSWATFKHRFLTHTMVVHDDEDALKAERRAMWTGRCEAYWRGRLEGQVVHEWDFTNAYARIARDNAVPVRFLGEMPKDYNWIGVLESKGTCLLAEVDIVTDTPVVPTSHDGRILWPIGSFKTTLWDVEIQAAIKAGATVTVTRGWLYRKRPALKAWAEWIIQRLHEDDDSCPAWQKLILKHWSRALIGRLAMTYQSWQVFAEPSEYGVMRGMLYDADTGELGEIMQVGNTIWQDTGREEWQHSMPMITGYVQAIQRVRTWNVLQALPEKVGLYVDTDSILCTDMHLAAVDSVANSPVGEGLRLKRSWQGFSILGPRQVVTGQQVRVSGMPHAAIPQGGGKFAGEVWDTLPGAIRRGNLDKVIARERVWNITGVDRRRNGTGLGWTTPIRLELLAPAT